MKQFNALGESIWFQHQKCSSSIKCCKKHYLLERVAPGQSHRKLSEAQAREVITFTAKKPHERMKEIQHALDSAGLSNDGVVQNFGIDVSNRMVEVCATDFFCTDNYDKPRNPESKRIMVLKCLRLPATLKL